jgi:hypothetical protein
VLGPDSTWIGDHPNDKYAGGCLCTCILRHEKASEKTLRGVIPPICVKYWKLLKDKNSKKCKIVDKKKNEKLTFFKIKFCDFF